MTWPEWPEVQRLTIVVAIFSVFLWQHGWMIFASALAGFLTG
jgi:preprotein translocase subunit SecE